MTRWSIIPLLAAALSGCLAVGSVGGCNLLGRPSAGEGPVGEPLPSQQARVYPETVTGRFVSLVDFEDSPGASSAGSPPSGRFGYQQLEWFSVEPSGGSCRFVVNVTRTGVGAMQVVLPPGGQLVHQLQWHNFKGHTLLSMSLHSQALRDDLQITLVSTAGRWTSPRILVRPGWNTVLVDMQRLSSLGGFDVTDVRSLRMGFTDAPDPVSFFLDDVMIIDNRRALSPVPDGVAIEKIGMDYRLAVAGQDHPMMLAQGPRGFWALGADNPVVQILGPGDTPSDDAEQLDLMGTRRIGAVEVIEQNVIRVRMASTWYFPSRSGQWASMAVRQIRWEYTFYGDGRWVTHLEINNPGGEAIKSVLVLPPQPVVLAGKGLTARLEAKDPGSVVRWSYLIAGGMNRAKLESQYSSPGRLMKTSIGEVFDEKTFVPGDTDRDHFDQSQGCYVIAGLAGHCRFTIAPPAGGLVSPVFRVLGPWQGPVSVSSEGLAIHDVVMLPDGSALFCLKGPVDSPTAIEVSGTPARPN